MLNKIFKIKYLLSFLLCYLFSATSKAFIPLPIPLPVGPNPKSIADLKDKAGLAADHLLSTISILQIMFIILLIWFTTWFTFKIFSFFKMRKINRLRVLLGRLYTEIILRDSGMMEKALSLKETIYYIEEMVNSKFFARRVGEHFRRRILDGLAAIKENKIDLDKQRALIHCWTRAFKVFKGTGFFASLK